MDLRKVLIIFLKLHPVCICGLIDATSCKFEDNTTMSCNHIPQTVLPGTVRVHVTDMHFAIKWEPMFISKNNFSKQGWSSIKYLEIDDFRSSINGAWYFEDGCFSRLTALKELHIHTTRINISENAFTETDKVKVLDLSHCAALGKETLLQALNGQNKLPNLRTLILKDWNSYRNAYDVDEEFVNALLPRKILHLDLSNTQIDNLDLNKITDYLKYLQILNISLAVIGDITYSYTNMSFYNDLEHIRVLDVSRTVFPMFLLNNLPFARVIMDINVTISSLNLNSIAFMFSAYILNISGLFPYYAPVFIDNVTIYMDTDINWFVKTIIMQENNIKRWNIRFICDNFTFFSLEHIDFSYNYIDLIHPSFIHCLPNLRIIDLSSNLLHKMIAENKALFEKLFQGHTNLEVINLSSNKLSEIPENTFINCKNVRVIDVSNNRLSQVTFNLNGLQDLRRLDLNKNNIKTLDQASLNRLNFFWEEKKLKERKETNLIITSNPFSCSECSSKPFLTWLTSKIDSGNKIQYSLCLFENGDLKNISKQTLDSVQAICDRKEIIIWSIVGATLFTSIFVLIGLLIYKRRKHIKRKTNKEQLIDQLRRGQGQYEFVVFLSHSSDDSEFVGNNIVKQLDEGLQNATGIERQLVCTGDKHFQLGAYVHDEIDRCLNKALVVIAVISNYFLDSVYCRTEFEQACVKTKPVILMLLGDVDVNRMSPKMLTLYKRNVRILWEHDVNNGYVMKTTWENVSKSILEILKKDEAGAVL